MGVPHTLATIGSVLGVVTTVAAHGYVKNIVINGLSYPGYDPTTFPYQSNPPIVVGWTTSQTDLGYVDPTNFGAPDIICHRSAHSAGGHARVAAGDSIALTWNTWPDSHHGPIIDYLAACNGPCEGVDKTALQFFKIDGAGKANPSATDSPGYWADDVMMADGLTWLVRIPPGIRPGNYVLRHEIIALHSANQLNGAQAYPQCFNLEITGAGADVPAGVLGTQLYRNTDPGIYYNLYTTPLPSYTVPGPALIAGATSSVPQSSSTITASGTATYKRRELFPAVKLIFCHGLCYRIKPTSERFQDNNGRNKQQLGRKFQHSCNTNPATGPVIWPVRWAELSRADTMCASGGGLQEGE